MRSITLDPDFLSPTLPKESGLGNFERTHTYLLSTITDMGDATPRIRGDKPTNTMSIVVPPSVEETGLQTLPIFRFEDV